MNHIQHDGLDDAIERLYEVFGSYQIPSSPSFCKHCVTKEEELSLRSRPLRELNATDLSRYWWKAMSTWGTVEQFKHFLPRLLEILVTQQVQNDPETLLKKLKYGGLNEWPDMERRAINLFCDALWRCAISHHPVYEVVPSFPSIDSCLCSIGQVVDDLAPFLNLWEQNFRPAATLHMIDFADENAAYIREAGKLWNTFWDERPVQMRQVQDWFMAHDFSVEFDVATGTVTNAELRENIARNIRKRSVAQ